MFILASFFKYFSGFAGLILAVNMLMFFLFLFKKGRVFKIYAIYLFVVLIGEIISKVMIYNGFENIVMSHYYFIFQFLLLSLFYLELINVNIQRKIIQISLLIIPVFLGIHYYLHPELIYKFNIIEVFITSFTLIIYATFHFYNMLSSDKKFYFINSGILVYLLGSTIIFLSGNVLIVKDNPLNHFLNVVHINITLYLFYLLMIFIEGYKTIKGTANNTI
ncbi:hypothetical protein [Flavobacterium sp. N2270]|uniref:hypothetical protein n=1 Tax=Flavobacterium sp. N2270 TaxID=2986831 RepID=UPI0022243B0F|nr:hypothetical protein [Flavobacterium sp. N2270]